MNNYLKTFIEDHIQEIENDRWYKLYLDFESHENYQYLMKNRLLTPADVTQIMAKAGINPLNYLNYVPFMFLGYSNVTEVLLPKNIESISNRAFYECKDLQDINLDNIKSIGDHAFYGCKKLNKINLRYNVAIYERAFTNAQIDQLYVPESLSTRTNISAFGGATINNLFYDGKESQFENLEMFFRDSKIDNIIFNI